MLKYCDRGWYSHLVEVRHKRDRNNGSEKAVKRLVINFTMSLFSLFCITATNKCFLKMVPAEEALALVSSNPESLNTLLGKIIIEAFSK